MCLKPTNYIKHTSKHETIKCWKVIRLEKGNNGTTVTAKTAYIRKTIPQAVIEGEKLFYPSRVNWCKGGMTPTEFYINAYRIQGERTNIDEGYIHSYKFLDDAIKECRERDPFLGIAIEGDYAVVECEIPSDTDYWEGRTAGGTFCYASDSIRFVKFIYSKTEGYVS